MERDTRDGRLRKGLRALRAGCLANLGLKLVAIVLALLLHFFLVRRPAAAPGPPQPPACMCPCPCVEGGARPPDRLPAQSGRSTFSTP